MCPRGQGHRLPMAERLQATLQHPLRLLLLGRDKADHILIKTASNGLGLDVGSKAILILAINII